MAMLLISIENFVKKYKLDYEDVQLRLLLLDLCLISENNTLEEMYKLAENNVITAEDIVAIEDWFKNNIWGVKEEIKVKCPKCGKEESRGYILALADFFSVL